MRYETKKKIENIGYGLAFLLVCILIAGGCYFIYNSAGVQRKVKSIKSNYSGGLERTVTVYDMEGQAIKEYKGKFDIETSDTKVMFDMEDGKRVTIYNATVISEETDEIE